MSELRLRMDLLREKAAEAGDATTYAMARRAGVETSTMSRLISGQTTPSVATLVRLRTAYNIKLDDLVVETQKVPA